MPAITIKNIPQELYEKLKHSAAAHHRSINSELISCLETILMPSKITPSERIARARKLRPGIPDNAVNAEEISNAIAQGRP